MKDCRNLAFILPIVDKNNVFASEKIDEGQVQKFFDIYERVKANGSVENYDDLVRTTLKTVLN